MPTTFANTINGNDILAKRAECDYAGNDIQQTYATKSEVTTGLSSKQDTISDLATIRSGAALGATSVQPGDLATVATSGDYDDLLNKPTIPPTLSAGNGIDITNNVVSADLDGTSLTNGANGLSVTLPVPDTTGASQGDVLTVGQSGIEWVTPGGGGDDAVLTYNVSTWSDFTTAYNAGKNIRVVNTVNGTTYEAVLHEYNPNGSPYGYAKFTATTLKTGVGAVSSDWYQISNIGSGVWTLGAGTIQGNYSGQGAISVNSSSHAISLTLDGSSLTQSSSGLAVANPLPSTLGTAGQVLQVNSGATGVEWATPSGGSVTDVEVDGVSVVSQGVASITMPTVDQTFDGSSSNAQSGVAIAGELATINQVPASTSADSGKVLTVDSSGIPGWVAGGSGSTGLFEAVYGQTTYADVVQAIADKKIVYCRVSPSGASRMAFLAYVGSSNVEFQYYRSLSSHTASNQTDEVYVYTVSSSGWTTTTRLAGIKYIAGTNMSQSYNSSNSTLTFSATMPTVDQTYDGTSTNAQSGVAVASAISTKQDTISDLATIRSGAADGATAVQPGDLATVATSGLYSDLSGTPTINNVPAVTSSDDNKVLKASYTGGVGSYSWEAESGGTVTDVEVNGTSVVSGGVADITIPAQVQSDWSEADSAANSYIQNKPVPKTLVAGTGITITETANDLTVAATATSYTAGTGISISAQNVITNTGVAINKTTPELCGSFMGEPVYTKLYEFTGTVGTSDTTVNFTIDEVVATGSTVTRIWLDPSNSFIEYGSASVKLPLTYFLSSARHGSVFVVSQGAGTLSFRGVDTSSVGLTFFLAVKYTDSTP